MKNDMGVLLLWLGRKLARNHEALITKMDAIQNLFETSAEATATPSDIMEGKTAYNGTILMTGTMENQGTKEATLLAGGTYSIPRGYHNGAGRVAAADLASQTAGTATAGGILSGLKAWVAGKAINGTMKDRRGVTVTASTVTQDDEYTYLTVPEEACYSASSKVRTKNSNLKSFTQTQLQVGSVMRCVYEQIYANNGYKRLTFTASGTGILTVYGSNDNGNTWTTLKDAASSGEVNIANYKKIKLVTGNTYEGYGGLVTYSIVLA